MLDKLAAEFTKSRPRHSNDNGLAETKNARSSASIWDMRISHSDSPPR